MHKLLCCHQLLPLHLICCIQPLASPGSSHQTAGSTRLARCAFYKEFTKPSRFSIEGTELLDKVGGHGTPIVSPSLPVRTTTSAQEGSGHGRSNQFTARRCREAEVTRMFHSGAPCFHSRRPSSISCSVSRARTPQQNTRSHLFATHFTCTTVLVAAAPTSSCAATSLNTPYVTDTKTGCMHRAFQTHPSSSRTPG